MRILVEISKSVQEVVSALSVFARPVVDLEQLHLDFSYPIQIPLHDIAVDLNLHLIHVLLFLVDRRLVFLHNIATEFDDVVQGFLQKSMRSV